MIENPDTHIKALNLLSRLKEFDSAAELARAEDKPERTVREWVQKAKTFEKPRYRVKAGRELKIADIPYKIVWFTDAHNAPKLSKERFFWLAEYINEKSPDCVVDTGDFDDFESLCSHVRNDSWGGRFKPAFIEDLESSNEAYQILHENIKAPVRLEKVEGNHEDRAHTFEDANPELSGMIQHAMREIPQKYGWNITPYRGYLDIQGVDFTHVPMNVMNKASGGKQLANTIAKGSVKDVCFGHTHKYSRHNEAKYGPSRSVTAIEGGSFMPQGYMPSYAKGSQKEFWYGCHYLTVLNGKILDHETISMFELERRYR